MPQNGDRREDGKRWAGGKRGGWVRPEIYEKWANERNPMRRSGIDPRTQTYAPYIGVWKNGKLQYKKAIAEYFGFADEDHQFENELTETRERATASRKRSVFPRHGAAHDPGGLLYEADVRSYWLKRMDNFEDFTADGSEAIGSDFRGFDRELQRTVYVEAQPKLHDLTKNEALCLSRAKDEGALYVIHTQRGWGRYTPEDFEPITVLRLKRKRA